MPEINKKYLRLYGHYMCPFVERARLVLAAKGIPYQDCQINLEDRTKWHREMNKGFVPILEVPPGDGKSDTSSIILESINIMNYLDKLNGHEHFFKGRTIQGHALYSPDPLVFTK